SLEALGNALRASTDAAAPDELHVRRERTRLLAAFDARLVPAPRRLSTPFWLGAVAAALTVAALFAVFRHAPAAAPALASRRVGGPEPVVVHADGSAKWSRQAEKQLETIRLESGALAIRVYHAVAPRRLLVILPDGELEDIGTTFSVSADAGHTTHVS